MQSHIYKKQLLHTLGYCMSYSMMMMMMMMLLMMMMMMMMMMLYLRVVGRGIYIIGNTKGSSSTSLGVVYAAPNF